MLIADFSRFDDPLAQPCSVTITSFIAVSFNRTITFSRANRPNMIDRDTDWVDTGALVAFVAKSPVTNASRCKFSSWKWARVCIWRTIRLWNEGLFEQVLVRTCLAFSTLVHVYLSLPVARNTALRIWSDNWVASVSIAGLGNTKTEHANDNDQQFHNSY